MPKKENSKKEEKKVAKEYKEVFAEGLSARLYPAEETGKGIKRSFMYLDFGNGFSIQCHFIETSNNYFIAFPQYKSGESYKSYVWVEKDSEMQNKLDALAEVIYNS